MRKRAWCAASWRLSLKTRSRSLLVWRVVVRESGRVTGWSVEQPFGVLRADARPKKTCAFYVLQEPEVARPASAAQVKRRGLVPTRTASRSHREDPPALGAHA